MSELSTSDDDNDDGNNNSVETLEWVQQPVEVLG